MAAAELLTRQKSPDAQLKQQQAQVHYQRLRARLSKSEPFVLGESVVRDLPLHVHKVS